MSRNCLKATPFKQITRAGKCCSELPTLGSFHVALCLFASGVESQNAFSIWQPLAQFPAAAVWRLENLLILWKITPSLWKSALLSLFPKPTSLAAASTGAASDFLRVVYPHMNGGANGDSGIPWHYKKKKKKCMYVFFWETGDMFFPSDFQKIP